MKSRVVIDTTKVVKNIDPLDVSAYKMKMIYQHRNDNKKVKSPSIGNGVKLYEGLKGHSLFPSIYNRSYMLGNY